MRTRQLRTSGSAGSTSATGSSPGKGTRASAVRRKAKAADIPAAAPAETFAKATAGGGSEIPYRSEMEGAFGQDFSGVRSHVGKGAAMDSLGAHAAASGESIAFGSASPDKHTVAHE